MFGSVANGTSTNSSDIDFLVEFEREGFEGAFDQFTGFKKTLENLYGKKVDLYTDSNFRNPEFSNEVNESKALIYGS